MTIQCSHLAWLGRHVVDGARWAARWYWDLSQSSWRRERGREGAQAWHALAFVVGVGLLVPYAMDAGLLLTASFLFSSFVALSLGYALRNPFVALSVYVGTVLGSAITPLFASAARNALAGELLAAGVLLAVAVYLMAHASALKRGELRL